MMNAKNYGDDLDEGCYAMPEVFEKAFSAYLASVAAEVRINLEETGGQSVDGQLAYAVERIYRAREVLRTTPGNVGLAKRYIFSSVNGLIDYSRQEGRKPWKVLKTVRTEGRPMLDGPMPGAYVDDLVESGDFDQYAQRMGFACGYQAHHTNNVARKGELEGIVS